MQRIPHTRQPGYLADIDRSTAIGKAVIDVFSPHGMSGQSLPQSKGYMTSTGQVVQSGKFGKVWNFATAPTDAVWTRDPLAVNPQGGSCLVILTPSWTFASTTFRKPVRLGEEGGVHFTIQWDGSGKNFEMSHRGNFLTGVNASGPALSNDAELQVRHHLLAVWQTESSDPANDSWAKFYQNGQLGPVESSGADNRAWNGTALLTMLTDVTGDVELIVFFDRPFSSAEAKALYVNSYRIFRPRIVQLAMQAQAGPLVPFVAVHPQRNRRTSWYTP